MTTEAPVIKEYDIPIQDKPLELPAPDPSRIVPIIIPNKTPVRVNK